MMIYLDDTRFIIGAVVLAAVIALFVTNNHEPSTPPFQFTERWSPVPAHAAPLLAKQVRTISLIPPAPANPVVPEIDGFLQLPMPPVKTQERPPQVSEELPPRLPTPKPRMAEPRYETKGPDICRGKGRIITRGGKSWRCRR